MSVRKNILTSWVSHAVTLALGFFMLPFILTTLGKTGYGAWLFVNAIAGYSVLLYMGFGATIARYTAELSAKEDYGRLNGLLSAIFALYCGLAGVAILFAVGIACIVPYLDRWGDLPIRDVQIVVLMHGLSTAVGMVGSVYGGVLIGRQRMDLFQSIETVMSFVRFGLIFSLLTWRPSLTTLSSIFLLVTIVENLLIVRAAYKQLPTLSLHVSNFRMSILRECLGFTSWSALSLIAEHLIFMTDTIVIGLCLGTEAVVPYAIALRICQMAYAPLMKIGDAVVPRAGLLHATGKKEELLAFCEKMAGLSFVLISACLIGCTYFAPMLLQVWVARGDEVWTATDNATSLQVLTILLAAQIIGQPVLVMRKTLTGMGIVRYPALLDCGQAALNLSLSIGLVFAFGVVGVAWGTLVPMVLIELILLLPYANREIGMTWNRLIRRGLLPQLPALAALLTYCWIVASFDPAETWINLLAIAAGGGGVLGATWLGTQALLKRGPRDASPTHSASPNASPLATGSLSS